MIFMSETGITDPSRERELDAWYVDHLKIMLTVSGVHSAQCFKSSFRAHPPSLAMYTFVSSGVFQDPYYLSVRGMGEWMPLIERKYYRRNLFEGLDRAPDVAQNERLLVADRAHPEQRLLDLPWAWLECVGIDRSTPFRGIAVVAQGFDESALADAGVALYTPVTTPMTK